MPRGELSTRSIVLDALSRGKAVLVPYLHNLESPDPITGQTKSKMDMLSLKSKEDFESLKPDRWGIPTLDANTVHNRENTFGNLGVDQKNSTNVPCRLDLILVPGMAFDRQRRRLGHGKGYYDHFLYRYQAIFNDSGLAPQMPLLGKALFSMPHSSPNKSCSGPCSARTAFTIGGERACCRTRLAYGCRNHCRWS